MKEGVDAIAAIMKRVKGDINTCAIAVVNSYDGDSADITLVSDGTLLLGVPVAMQAGGGFMVSMPLQSGDMVVVVFAQHEVDGVVSGTGIASNRSKDINDAIIVGCIKNGGKGSTDGLYMGKEDGSAFISISKDSKTEIFSPNGVKITGMNGESEF